jgi:cation diffusion facilitator family transporter
MGLEKRTRASIRAVDVGLAANFGLAVVKTGVGVLGHSPALLADGINSTSDVAYGIVVRIFMRLSTKPADDKHPYGHSQMESIAAVVVGAFVVTTAVAIFWTAINRVYDLWSGSEAFAGASVATLWVALFTVAAKTWLSVWTLKIGRQTRNSAIVAFARDHRNDVFSALAVTVGIFFGRAGFPWVDPLAGAVVSLVILKTGIEILRDASGDLMDSVPGKDLSHLMSQLISKVPGVEEVEQIRAHRFGVYLIANVTIGVEGGQSVAEGHEIATRVEQTLLDNIEYMRWVHVHYHPSTLSEKKRILKAPFHRSQRFKG